MMYSKDIDKSWSFLKPYQGYPEELKKMDTDIVKYVRHLELGSALSSMQNKTLKLVANS